LEQWCPTGFEQQPEHQRANLEPYAPFLMLQGRARTCEIEKSQGWDIVDIPPQQIVPFGR
jgi:hypothetical protein